MYFAVSQENATLSVVRVNDECGEDNKDVNLTVEGIYTTPTKKLLANSGGDSEKSCAGADGEVDITNGVVVSKLNLDSGAKTLAQGQEALTGKAGEHGLLEGVVDPLLDLDQEEIEKIEHALQSEQARQLLGATFGGILGQGTDAEAALDVLLDPDLTGGCFIAHIAVCTFLTWNQILFCRSR